MTNASVHSNHLPRQELNSSIVEINEESPFQRQKSLIRVWMTMPVVSLGHDAYADFVIVDLGNGMVVVAVRRS